MMKHYVISKKYYSSKEEKALFLKKIYDYCMNVGWKKSKLDELAKLLEVDRLQIKTWARKYVREFLRDYLGEEECVKINNLIDELIKQDTEITRLTLSKYNPILYEIKGKKTYLLWEDEEEKELVLKYIYDYCEKYNYSPPKIAEFSVWLGMNFITYVENYAKQYAVEYLGFSDEQWNNNRREHGDMRREISYKKRNNNSKYVYEKLLKAKNLEEIILIIESSNFDIYTLKSELVSYIIVHQNGNQKMIDLLKSKIKMYTDYISKQRKDDRLKEREKIREEEIESQLSIAKEKVREFLDDVESDSIVMFCEVHNIDRDVFSNYVAIVKEKDLDLFNLYDNKVKTLQSQRYAVIIEKVNLIINYLKNGVEEYGVTRQFDLIDYYMITSISLSQILKLSKDFLSKDNLLLLKKFINQNISGEKNNPSIIKQIMSEKVIINYEKDKNGLPIPGTEELFSNDEKERLIKFLKNNNIPINLKTYNLVFRRYRNGLLDIEKNEKQK